MLKKLSVAAALAGVAVAQDTPSLAAALNSSSDLSTLQGLVPQNVLQALNAASNITILAPSNDAFGKISSQELSALTSNPGLITALLQYHVLNGSYLSSAIPDDGVFVPTLLTNMSYTNVTGGQVVRAESEDDTVVFFSGNNNNSTVTTANVNFTGGVIHIIDNLLTIPGLVSDVATTAGLTSVRGALVEANLVETVNTTPDLTVFAPSNDAFKNIGSALPNLTVEDLSSILTYHVVAGTVGYSTRLSNGTSLQTVNGQNITISIGDDGIFVNNAKVITANVLVANGVVHVIDEVLNPSNATAADADDQDDGEPAFSGASPVSEAPFTSGQPTASTTLAAGPTTASGSASASGSSATEATANVAASMPTGAASLGALLGAAAVYFL